MRRFRQQTQERTPDQTLHQTPEQSPPQTPLTLQHTSQSPRQTPDPNMQDESSSDNTGIWKVGSMHNDGRLQVEIIRGV